MSGTRVPEDMDDSGRSPALQAAVADELVRLLPLTLTFVAPAWRLGPSFECGGKRALITRTLPNEERDTALD